MRKVTSAVLRFSCFFLGIGQEKFVGDLVAAWAKVMNADRFDPQRA